jgi:hypothetical protein
MLKLSILKNRWRPSNRGELHMNYIKMFKICCENQMEICKSVEYAGAKRLCKSYALGAYHTMLQVLREQEQYGNAIELIELWATVYEKQFDEEIEKGLR